MFSPKNTNGVEPPQSNNPADPFFMSVPDQYHVRAGFNFPLPEKRISIGLGACIDGIPVTDAFGDNDGFRRPGHAVYIEPGVTFATGTNVFNFWVPVALARNMKTSVFDAHRGVQTAGGLADFLIMVGYTRRFLASELSVVVPPCLKTWWLSFRPPPFGSAPSKCISKPMIETDQDWATQQYLCALKLFSTPGKCNI